MGLLKITRENFEREVVYAEKTVLVTMWANWASPSKKMLPIMDEIAQELGNQITVGIVNTEEERDIAAQFHAFRLPMIAVVKDGEITASAMGVRSKEKIMEMLDL